MAYYLYSAFVCACVASSSICDFHQNAICCTGSMSIFVYYFLFAVIHERLPRVLGTPSEVSLHRPPSSFFFPFPNFCLSLPLSLTLHLQRGAAIAFVGWPNYTRCHVGGAAGSQAHGRFTGFNYISLAGHRIEWN